MGGDVASERKFRKKVLVKKYSQIILITAADGGSFTSNGHLDTLLSAGGQRTRLGELAAVGGYREGVPAPEHHGCVITCVLYIEWDS